MNLIKIGKEIKDHIENQPYSAKCKVCGQALFVDTDYVNDNLNVYITVQPCCNCKTKEKVILEEMMGIVKEAKTDISQLEYVETMISDLLEDLNLR